MIGQGGVPKLWWTAQELANAKLPGLPTVKRKVNEFAQKRGWAFEVDAAGLPLARARAGRGGGLEYHRNLLPPAAIAALIKRGLDTPAEVEPATERTRDQLWGWFERQPEKVQAEARERLTTLDAIEQLAAAGHTVTSACAIVAADRKVGVSTLYEWRKLVRGVAPSERLPRLAPMRQGCTETAEIHPDIWTIFKSDYLRPEKPTLNSCWRRARDAASKAGIEVPCAKTFQRRIERETDALVLARLRGGPEALRRMVPALQRSVLDLHALEAVNIDGHEWDVRVDFGPKEDGSPDIGRPMMVMIQDVYSRKVLAWRIGRSESAGLVQLAFADLFRNWGIPGHCVFDNGRAFASKWITGGAPYRFRGKELPGDPLGLMNSLGIQVHWTTPYRGQSKPIERAFGDLERNVGTHPAFAGAYTGRSPLHKPENYGAKAVPLEAFMAVLEQGLAEHNARADRRTEAAKGRSFDIAFEESYRASIITKATDADLRRALLAAEKVRADKPQGAVTVFGNRYWDVWLTDHAGKALTARFDPENLHQPLHLYDHHTGIYLGTASVDDPAGFFSAEAAKRQAKRVADARKAAAIAIEKQNLVDAAAVARAYAGETPETEAPSPAATRPARVKGGAALARIAEPARRPLIDRLNLEDLAPQRAARPALRLVED
ncbi:DDE-type integrase/transposase/recombinase [Caulobacter sp. SLTY]|uniref:transposase domain-containing protein n=1 Tax=Caulobacter sp. SLTY TaxID=2683262 RepID=UPI001412FCAB|nr:transposase domain-containing protein [Caulobacter sp. SLTY]NBB17009.1 DDE-type integrase/transposase/recombinase [Caulobacter sp. SLTY]